jgi:peptide/nickel transport system ATP-binding protein
MSRGKLVEIGPAEQVYSSPQDEYTKALLAAVPIPDPRKMKERKRERRKFAHTLAEAAEAADAASLEPHV